MVGLRCLWCRILAALMINGLSLGVVQSQSVPDRIPTATPTVTPVSTQFATPVVTPASTANPTPSPTQPSIVLSSPAVLELTLPEKLSVSAELNGIAPTSVRRVDFILDAAVVATASTAPFAISNLALPFGVYKLSAKAYLDNSEVLSSSSSIVSIGRTVSFGRTYGLPATIEGTYVPLRASSTQSAVELRWPRGALLGLPAVSRGVWNGFGVGSPSSVQLPVGTTGYRDSKAADPSVGPSVYGVSGSSGIGRSDVAQVKGSIFFADKLTFPESRGGVLLIVDETLAPNLRTELDALTEALRDEMWEPTVIQAPRMQVEPADTSSTAGARRLAEVKTIRGIARTFYKSDPKKNRFAILIGHLPVPYSGIWTFPDGHPNHIGAWPTDLYYADIDGNWSDSRNSSVGSLAANVNRSGDGKFDQDAVPSSSLSHGLELAVGRIDFSNLSGAGVSELQLTRTYLQRDVAFRRGEYGQIGRRVLIDDNFGFFAGEAFSKAGYTLADQTFGFGSRLMADWFTTLNQTSVLVANGCGGGSFTSISGVGKSSDFYTKPSMSVFNLLFGSYFGDWNTKDNVMRASLASQHPNSLGLVSFWAGRPGFTAGVLAIGEPVGKMLFVPEYRDSFYYYNPVQRAILGDPTLRLLHQPGVRNLSVSADSTGVLTALWGAADQNPVGYHVYGAANLDGPWTRLTGIGATTSDKGAIKDLRFVIPANYPFIKVYPLYLNTNSSGSYYSLGAATKAGPLMALHAVTKEAAR